MLCGLDPVRAGNGDTGACRWIVRLRARAAGQRLLPKTREPGIRTMNSCYACTAEGSSIEHAPPRCLFPKHSEYPEAGNLRRELITVPSCNEHNSEKSKDDVLFRWSVATNGRANQVGAWVAMNKVRKEFHRRPALGSTLLETAIPVRLALGSETKASEYFRIDLGGERLQRSIDLLGRALYRHEFGSSYLGPMRSAAHYLLGEGADAPPESQGFLEVQALFDLALSAAPRRGCNPSVFWYQASKVPGIHSAIFRVAVYEGCKIDYWLGESLA